MRKSVFGFFDRVRLKPTCSVTETSWNIEILHEARLDIILSNKGITKVPIRLHSLRLCYLHAT